MKGSNITYNLRPNKHIERSLFIDMLNAYINKKREKYVYISLGGPQLEDQKLIHYQLGLKKLISLESNKLVYDRQLFNRRPGCIDCRHQSVDEFIADFTSIDEQFPEEDFIIWLDYAAANEKYKQLSEFESLVNTLNDGDIIKITMNANVTTLSSKLGIETNEELQERRYIEAARILGEYFSKDEFEVEDMTRSGFIRVVKSCINRAIIKGIRDDLTFKTLLSFSYADGPHVMINVAIGLFDFDKTTADQAIKRISSKWNFVPKNDEHVLNINMPNLSIKERLRIEGEMFQYTMEEIHDRLPFNFDDNNDKSMETLRQYFVHYRKYPGYLSVKI